ncbi:TM2 domain containing 2 [Phyllostomus discolor]|uniref:TM2 domain containing 2 n=1 Tax=Phyllostomus discolor TaxID=89673 RepID=A0A833Z2T9_9CHIR|nr:TM2 domain containing 2 [Phyllostomus discolor]
MVLGGCPVSYLLLCGQAALLLGNLLLLHCVSRSHSYNATAEPELTSAGATNPEFVGASSWEYGDPNSPVILCSYLSVVRPTAMWNTQPSSAAPWTGLSVPVLGPSCERINLA